ncbi:uridine phosphorylase [Rhodotorula toruloides]|uniref:Uridine phosphorylase n=1 Tax=Rhodotorula toruloides TaxID=5286 RepID=A0A511KJT2_RHOTO|nr:uridine phosphorylase [Rhodotorula toruloides]
MTVSKTINANFPMDDQGHVHHVGVRAGQVANRILTVGDPSRLRRIASFLDPEPKPFENTSSRGYTVVTGRYKGVEVSLIAIGMGVAMVDFFVREVRVIVSGDITIIRFGSCGSLDPSLRVGSIGVPERAVQISTSYAHWHAKKGEEVPGYVISPPQMQDYKHTFVLPFSALRYSP